MKKIIFSALILVIAASARAQKVDITVQSSDGHGGKVTGSHGVKLTSFSCRTIDAGHAQELTELAHSFRKENFEELFAVRQGKGRLQLLSRDGKDGQTEVVCLLVGKEGNGVYLTVAGDRQH